MEYDTIVIPSALVPRMPNPLLQHIPETYVSETNKVASVWRAFDDADLSYRPHERSSTVQDVIRHQLLSERRFFGEFMGTPEPSSDAVVPVVTTIDAGIERLRELAVARLGFLAGQPDAWWTTRVPFFDVERERIWIFWRRVLHTAHHRTQLSVYLRLLNRPVPPTYGPTADVTWTGADPTRSAESAGRK